MKKFFATFMNYLFGSKVVDRQPVQSRPIPETIMGLLVLDQLITEKIEKTTDPELKKFLAEEVQFLLRQRINDLMWSVVSYERAVRALRLAATVAIASKNQRRIVEAMNKIDEITEQIIREKNIRVPSTHTG